MVTFITKVYNVEEEDIIGAEVKIYSEEGNKVGTIHITSAEQLNALENRLTELEGRPISSQEVIEIINSVAINANTLQNKSASEFATSNHSHNDYAPKNHKSSATTYGVGTSSEHGHVRVADNLTTSSFNSGSPVVLSAKQGYQLNQALTQKVAKTDIIDNLNTNASNKPLSAKMGRDLQNSINQIKDHNHIVEPLYLNSQWKNSSSWCMTRNGFCVLSVYATLNLPEGQYIAGGEALNIVNMTENYKPLDFMEGVAQLVVPNVGRVMATLQINNNGEVHAFHDVDCPGETLLFGTLIFPIRNYDGQ